MAVGNTGHTSKISDDSEILTVDTFGFRGEALGALILLSDSLSIRSRRRQGHSSMPNGTQSTMSNLDPLSSISNDMGNIPSTQSSILSSKSDHLSKDDEGCTPLIKNFVDEESTLGYQVSFSHSNNVSQTKIKSTNVSLKTFSDQNMSLIQDQVSKINYDLGRNKERIICAVASNPGTTITIKQFMSAFPVRRTEWSRSVSRNFTRLIALIQMFILCKPNVRFRLVHSKVESSNSALIVASSGSGRIPRAYQEAFKDSGTILRNDMCSFDWQGVSTVVEIHYDSISNSNSSRRSADRQFVMLRGRPVEIPKLMRKLNDIWRSFTRLHDSFPILIVAIDHCHEQLITESPSDGTQINSVDLVNPSKKSKKARFDINLAPDKRQVVFEDEGALIQPIIDLFGSIMSRQCSLPASLVKDHISGTSEAKSFSLVNSHISDHFQVMQPPKSLFKLEAEVLLESKPVKAGLTHVDEEAKPPDSFEVKCFSQVKSSSVSNLTEVYDVCPPRPIQEKIIQSLKLESNPSENMSADSNQIIKQNLLHSNVNTPIEKSQSCECPHDLKKLSRIDENIMFNKEDFSKLEVIGQFNCGFILTELKSGVDSSRKIFILDQHASDERYRLESLEKSLVHTTQRLVVPKQILNLAPQDLVFLKSNIDLLATHGFQISIGETSPDKLHRHFQVDSKLNSQTKKNGDEAFDDVNVYLMTVPTVCGIQMTDEDLHETIYLMQQGNFEGLHSLDRVANLLASRACRSAIMIGDHLTLAQMQMVVRNLESLRRPWICAHGRPTIRLLYDL